MRKSNFKILALTAALIMPLSSCKETIIYVTPEDIPNDDIKTPIELSVGGVDGAVESSSTRAVITDDNTKTYNPFDKDTKIFMVMKSTYGTEDYLGSHKDKYTVSRGEVKANTNAITFDALNQKYWDDAHARSSQLDIWAYASMVPSTWNTCYFQVPDPNWTALSTETLEHKMLEYIKKDYETNTQAADKSPYPWTEHTIGTDKGSMGAIYPCIMEWKVTNTPWAQTANSIQYQDLMFSNNLANNTERGGSDKRLKFNNQQTKKFDTGEMKFYHAMSKLTINIIEGDGFDKTSQSDFQFATGKNIKLNRFNTQGTFNIKNGYFEKVEETRAEITSIAQTSPKGVAPNPYYTLQALAIPNINGINSITDTYSRFDKDASNTMMEFTIDNNTFKITSGALYNALHKRNSDGSISNDVVDNATKVDNTYIPLEAGKNYIFTFVVGKTKIEHLTATVAQWEDVEAATVEPKINVTATYGYTVAQGGTGVSSFTNNYDLFRSTTKATGYDEDNNTADINPAARYTSSSWDKTIYWPDHQTHYFFRGVYPQVGTAVSGTTIVGAEAVTTANGNDIVAVANAKYTAATYPSDLAIAIPRGTTTGTYDETCKETGHTAQEGICATEGVINMNFEYAMSKVEVRLKSSKTDAAHIALTKDNTKVEIIGAYSKARIKLSDGLHDAYVDDDKGDYTLSNLTTAETGSLVTTRDAIVPQVIDNDVLFRITVTTGDNGTPSDPSDDPTDVYECKVNLINVKNSSPATPVTEWVHGKHYIYELDLNKTDIKVTATITNWETVNASGNIWF